MAEFEWDPGKAAVNRRKHGVDFADGATILADDRLLTREDPTATGEQRFVSIGIGATGRLLVVIWCRRGEAIRIISARRANRWEQAEYGDG